MATLADYWRIKRNRAIARKPQPEIDEFDSPATPFDRDDTEEN